MRRLALLALPVAAAAISLVGCGSNSSSAEGTSTGATTQASPPPPATTAPTPDKAPRAYTKRDLARLVLQPKDAPADMLYVKGESGPMTFEQIGFILPRQIEELRAYGVRAVRDSVFAAKSPQSDRRAAERVWLLKSASAASQWLARSKDDSVGLGFTELPPSGLGDESWAINGQAQGGVVITHAFRLGNAVFLATSFSSQEAISPATARAVAAAAFARARKV